MIEISRDITSLEVRFRYGSVTFRIYDSTGKFEPSLLVVKKRKNTGGALNQSYIYP
jgi:hypothetical protein